MADITIELGDKEFKISGLTVRQSRDLRIGDDKVSANPSWDESYQLCVDTILAAIRVDHPNVTADELWDNKASETEIIAARKAILVHAGFRKPDPTIADLRAEVASTKLQLAVLEKTLAEREEKAKVTGEE